MLGVFINLLYTHTMPNIYYCSTFMLLYPHLMAKHWLRVGRKLRFLPRNLPTWGCKSMVEGPTIMLGVFINLLYTHTMPNIYYCSTFMLLYPHLMAKHWLRVGRKLRFLPRNLPTWGCKSMVEGPTIMLGVFIDLLHTHTMPNMYYCSTCMLLCPSLMAKRWLRVGRKLRFLPRNLPTWGCKSMVEGPTIMLGVFIDLLHTHTMPNMYYCSTCMLLCPSLMAKRWLRVGRKSRFFPDLRLETCLHGAVKLWWRALQSCWECSSTCYTPIQCQTSTIAAPSCCYTPT